MPKGSVEKLPCPYCPYEAWSQGDLASHIKFSHGGDEPEKEAEAVVESTPQTPPQEEKAVEPEGRSFPPGIFVPKPQPDFWVAERVAKELYIIGKTAFFIYRRISIQII